MADETTGATKGGEAAEPKGGKTILKRFVDEKDPAKRRAILDLFRDTAKPKIPGVEKTFEEVFFGKDVTDEDREGYFTWYGELVDDDQKKVDQLTPHLKGARARFYIKLEGPSRLAMAKRGPDTPETKAIDAVRGARRGLKDLQRRLR